MFYSPATNQYWAEPFRIAAINMEPYGYENTGVYNIERDELVSWIYDAGNCGTRTTRYTMTLLSVILSSLECSTTPTPEEFRSAFGDDEKIMNALDRTVYYNIRPQSNTQKAQDYAAISSTGGSEIGRLVWDEIQALDPHVILIAGQAGLAALNQLLLLQQPLRFRGSLIHNGILIHSIAHPSRPSYSEWVSIVMRIVKWTRSGALPNEVTISNPCDSA